MSVSSPETCCSILFVVLRRNSFFFDLLLYPFQVLPGIGAGRPHRQTEKEQEKQRGCRCHDWSTNRCRDVRLPMNPTRTPVATMAMQNSTGMKTRPASRGLKIR